MTHSLATSRILVKLIQHFQQVREDADEPPPAKKSKKAKGKEPEVVEEALVDDSPFADEPLHFAEEDVAEEKEELPVEAVKEEPVKKEKVKKAKKGKKERIEAAKEAEVVETVDDTPFDSAFFSSSSTEFSFLTQIS